MSWEDKMDLEQASRMLRVTIETVPEKSNWVSLPLELCNQLAEATIPLLLSLTLLDGTGFPVKGREVGHVAWSGSASRNNKCLELSTELAKCMLLQSGSRVILNPLLDKESVPAAVSVEVEPASESDWEILEHNAGHVEDVMLQQVAVLTQGMAFPIWVRNQSLVMLMVRRCSPASTVRLVPGCEVHVQPKPRQASQTQRGNLMAGQGQQLPSSNLEKSEASATWATTSLRVLPLGTDYLIPLKNHSKFEAGQATCTWLTAAALLSPCDVLQVLGPPDDRQSTRPGDTLQLKAGQLLLVRPGREMAGPVRQAAVRVVFGTYCPPGHIMLAPPLLQALGLLAHSQVQVHVCVGDSSCLLPTKRMPDIAQELGGGHGREGNASSWPLPAAAHFVQQIPSVSLHPLILMTEVDQLKRPGQKSIDHKIVRPSECKRDNPAARVLQGVSAIVAENKGGIFQEDQPGGNGTCLDKKQRQQHQVCAALLAWLQHQALIIEEMISKYCEPTGKDHVRDNEDPGILVTEEQETKVKPCIGSGDLSPISTRILSGGTSGTDATADVNLASWLPLLPGMVMHLLEGGQDILLLLTFEHEPMLRGIMGLRGQPRIFPVGWPCSSIHQSSQSVAPCLSLISCNGVHMGEPITLRIPQLRSQQAHLANFLLGTGSSVYQPVMTLVEELRWLKPQLETCLKRLIPGLDDNLSKVAATAGVPRCGGLLLTGAAGSGKSALLTALQVLLSNRGSGPVHCVHVQCSRLAVGQQATSNLEGRGNVVEALSDLVLEALECQPSLLVLDDIDLLLPSGSGGVAGLEEGGQESRGTAASLADWLAEVMDVLLVSGARVAWAGSARDAAAVQAVMRMAGHLDAEVRLPAPGSEARRVALAAGLRARRVAGPSPYALARVIAQAEGCDAQDLVVLLDRALHIALSRQLSQQRQTPERNAPSQALMSVSEEDFISALEGFVPAAFWTVSKAQGAGKGPGGLQGWQDVGGMQEAREALQEALELPFKHAALVAGAPLRLRTGLLLYGPPGCGKTHIVAAAAAAMVNNVSMRLISVKGPELLNKYIGASEAAVRDLFQRAAAAAPCLLFFDEFDAIAPPRGHDSTGVTDRVVNQLLTELDGVEGLRGVCVLAATSRPDLIDAALLRPGRLDRLVYCGLPDEEARLQILKSMTRKLSMGHDVDLEWLATHTEHLTGADLGAILSEAQLLAVHDVLNTREAAVSCLPNIKLEVPCTAQLGVGVKEPLNNVVHEPCNSHIIEEAARSRSSPDGVFSGGSVQQVDGVKVTMVHLKQALNQTRPSLPSGERNRLEHIYAHFRQKRDPNIGSRDKKGKGKKSTLA